DGGANVSFNGGRTWTEQDQATAQFYRVALDNDFPYNVYGAQQDNSTVRIPSRTTDPVIDRTHWYDVGGGESGWIAPYPRDSMIIFAGSYGGLITRYDHHTGQLTNVSPWPDNPMGSGAAGLKYRFQLNFPILFSPHDPDTLYAGANVLFESINQGKSWQEISPDLTRNDKTRQGPSGGPITKDNTSIEYYSTIFTVMESPVQKGVIWAGSDDGLVHVTRNGGKDWENVTPKGMMPEWIQINSIDASPNDAATAYFAGTMYKSDDYRPYLYKTSDYGKTWKKITGGIPDGAFTRVIREDPSRRGLLYAGTENGIYVSFDDGENWQSLQSNLPVVPITDLAVHKREKDLVAATQGRSFWVLDGLAVLHQITDQVRQADIHLFKPEEAYRMAGAFGGRQPNAAVGENPPGGVVVYYFFKSKPEGEVSIEFLDSANKVIRKFSSTAPRERQASAPADDEGSFGGSPPARVATEAGLNRFVWDMRYPEASRFPGLILWSGEMRGPRVVPGIYQVRLTTGGKSSTETFEIKKDPRLEASQADFAKQFELLLKIRDKLTETHDAIVRIRDVRKQVEEVSARARDKEGSKPIADAARTLASKLTAVEEELYQTKNQSNQDPLNYPIRLNNKLAALAGVVGSGDTAPTDQSYKIYDELSAGINAQLQKLDLILREDTDSFNKLVRETSVPAVIIKPK
ncbi:MAG TPA: glycosyl hydrolase, partial [Blastocatellia bacterium]|nr:glycosyl hydrolase [Blastocatellia bacterium]